MSHESSTHSSRQVSAVTPTWLGVLALLTAVGPLSVDMYLPAFPAMAAEFHASPALLQLTLTTFMIGMAAGQLIGPLSDRWGRRRLLMAGTILCTVASAACALAPSVQILAVFRLLQGVGGAAGVVLSRAVVTDLAQGATAARIFSIMMIVNGAAPVVAPLVGGNATHFIGWRGVFWILTALSTLMVVGAVSVVKETHPRGPHRGRDEVSERKTTARAILLGRHYLCYTVTFASGFATMFAFISASPFVLQSMLGLSVVGNGIAMASIAIGLLAVNALNAKVVGRLGQRRLLLLGVAHLVVFSGVVVAEAIHGPGIWVFIPLLWCSISSLGLVIANATALALDQTRQLAGAGSAVLGILQYGLAAAVAPVAGLGGGHTAVPMALAMFLSAVAAAAAALTAGPSDASAPNSGQPYNSVPP